MSNNSQQVVLILKVFSIIQFMSQKQETSIKEIQTYLGLNSATIYKCLQTLCDIGYAYQNEHTQQYGLTLRFASICSSILSHYSISEISIPTMKKIGELTKETVHLGLREGSNLVYIYQIDSPHTLKMYSSIGKIAPLYCTAMGKMFLAQDSPEQQEQTIDSSEIIAYTQNTLTDSQKIMESLALIKKQNYAENIEELEPHIRCLAMPIFDYTGKMTASLSISLPVFRWNDEIQHRNLEFLRQGVEEISHKLGSKRVF
ncbi:MAG: IclR family transcriptional regulator [Brevinema sp.]